MLRHLQNLMKQTLVSLFLLFCVSKSQYATNNPSPPQYHDPYYHSLYNDPIYEPRIVSRVQSTVQAPDKSLSEIFSIIFSCGAMTCTMFIKRPTIKRIFKTRSASFINEVGMLAESAREVGITSFTAINAGEFHTVGQLTVGTILNIFILILAVFYGPKSRRETFMAALIGLFIFAYGFISTNLNHSAVVAMPYIGSSLLILWRMHLISKIKRTKTIVGTTTYRAQYLGAFGMACRICSFLVVSDMNLARWLYIGVPFLSILVLLYFHFHYDVKEPDSKKLYEVESGFFQSSEVSFSKKSK